MPLVRVDLAAGRSATFRTAVGDVVYGAMVALGRAWRFASGRVSVP